MAGSYNDNTQIGLLRQIKDHTVVVNGGNYTVQDFSGVIVDANVAQNIAVADSNRKVLVIQALSNNTESVWFNYDGAATIGLGSFELIPGAFRQLEVGEADKLISVIAVVAGQGFTVKGKIMMSNE